MPLPVDQLGDAGRGLTGAINSWLVNRFVLPQIEKLPPGERRRIGIIVAVWILVLTPAAGFGIWRLLARIAETRAGMPGAADLALIAGGAELGLPSGFLAFLLTAIPLSFWMEGREWKQLANLPLILFTFAILLFFTWLAAAFVDWYVVLTPTHIRYNPFLSVDERSYRYEQARTIRTAPAWTDLDGNNLPVREYLICFDDGGLWGTMWHPGRFLESDKARVVQRFAERSKVAIEELNLLRREDQTCAPTGKAQDSR